MSGKSGSTEGTDEVLLTRRDKDKKFECKAGHSHTFRLRRYLVRWLEIEDVLFHYDSAVMMPDSESGDEPGTIDQERITGPSGRPTFRKAIILSRSCSLPATLTPRVMRNPMRNYQSSGRRMYFTFSQVRRMSGLRYQRIVTRMRILNTSCDGLHAGRGGRAIRILLATSTMKRPGLQLRHFRKSSVILATVMPSKWTETPARRHGALSFISTCRDWPSCPTRM